MPTSRTQAEPSELHSRVAPVSDRSLRPWFFRIFGVALEFRNSEIMQDHEGTFIFTFTFTCNKGASYIGAKGRTKRYLLLWNWIGSGRERFTSLFPNGNHFWVASWATVLLFWRLPREQGSSKLLASRSARKRRKSVDCSRTLNDTRKAVSDSLFRF